MIKLPIPFKEMGISGSDSNSPSSGACLRFGTIEVSEGLVPHMVIWEGD
jgi:hypothetical protein